MGIGDWGLGIGDGDWGVGPIPNPPSPIPNPHIEFFSEINKLTYKLYFLYIKEIYL